MNYAEMYPSELEKVLEESPIVYIPMGSLEWHDNHLPFGTDSFIAVALSERLCQKFDGVVLPPQFMYINGIGREAGRVYEYEKALGSLDLKDEEIYERYLRLLLEELARTGFKYAIFVPGHVGQPERDIQERLAKEFTEKEIINTLYIYIYAVHKGDHAGKFETAMMQGLRPDKVRSDAEPVVNPWAYEPISDASLDFGREHVGKLVDWMIDETAKFLAAHGRPAS